MTRSTKKGTTKKGNKYVTTKKTGRTRKTVVKKK